MSERRSAAETGDSGTEAGQERSEAGAEWSLLNWVVIGVFGALTAVGLVLSTGVLEWAVAIPASGADPNPVAVPVYVYLYAGFGALGYIFTKLMGRLDRYTEWNRWEDLVGLAMRIPAAWVLAAGVYLLLGAFDEVEGVAGPRFAAGVAFLVGLYVNVALKALGSLADRILGRAPMRSK